MFTFISVHTLLLPNHSIKRRVKIYWYCLLSWIRLWLVINFLFIKRLSFDLFPVSCFAYRNQKLSFILNPDYVCLSKGIAFKHECINLSDEIKKTTVKEAHTVLEIWSVYNGFWTGWLTLFVICLRFLMPIDVEFHTLSDILWGFYLANRCWYEILWVLCFHHFLLFSRGLNFIAGIVLT